MNQNQKQKIFFCGLTLILILFLTSFHRTGDLSILTITPTAKAETRQLIFDFFDVGQGDSELIRLPGGENILVDGGPDNKVLEKLGEHLPFYNKNIDLLILTHPHSDHLKGLVEVLNRYEVKKIMMTGVLYSSAVYSEFLKEIKNKNIPVEIIDHWQEIKIDDSVLLSILWPEKSLDGQSMENINNSSIVFKIIYGSTTALFMGDDESEEKLLFVTSTMKSDILKVGHYGSVNANDKNFLSAVSPAYAIIPVGKNNTYKLPGYRTLFNLRQLNAKIFRTDENGDVELFSDGKKIYVNN
ncbi:MAG: MBL fold metallo-hydrolase [Actinomycetota bacterium]